MPTATEQLAEQYRVQQATIGAGTAAVMLRLWPLLVSSQDQDAVDQWLQAVVRLVTLQRNRSALGGQAFVTALRRQSLGTGVTPFIPTPEPVNVEKIERSLYAVGVRPLDEARKAAQETAKRAPTPTSAPFVPAPTLETIQANVARAAQRHTLDGGRTVIDDTIRRDARVVGYQRVGRAKPCFWCAMLNSRPPVYNDQSFSASDPRFTGPGNAKCHDGCGCSLVPLYKRAELADTTQPDLEAKWIEFTKGKSGPAAIRAFRQAYEGRLRT